MSFQFLKSVAFLSAVGTIALASGCTVPPIQIGQNASQSPAPAASVPATTAPATPAPTTTAQAPTGAAPSAAPTTTAQAPIASNYQTQGTHVSTAFTVRVVELRRASDNSLFLKLALTNNGQQSLGFYLFNVTQNDSVYVVDPTEQKKAYPLKDSSGTALSSKAPSVEPGQTTEIFVQFPSPPATTKRLNIYFPDATSPIMDVPIS